VLPLAKRVVAVEPDPKVFEQLQARLGARATCVKALVGPEGEARTFLYNTIASSSSTSVPAGTEPPGHEYLIRSPMTSVSLDALVREHGRPDLIKIDVEGAELNVLQSGREVLATKPLVLMEFNTLCLSEYGKINPREAIERILNIFPKVEVILPEGRERVTDGYYFLYKNVLERHALDNLLCSWD
jgi:FkbM family methyltransferase